MPFLARTVAMREKSSGNLDSGRREEKRGEQVVESHSKGHSGGAVSFYSFRVPTGACERPEKKIIMMEKMFPRKADSAHRKRHSEFKVRFRKASLGEAFLKSLIIIFYFWKLSRISTIPHEN